MATTPRNTTQGANGIFAMYSPMFIAALRGKLGFLNKITKLTSLEPSGKGASVKFQIPATFTAQTRTSGNQTDDYSFATDSDSYKTITIDTETYVAFGESTLLGTFQDPSAAQGTIENAVTSLLEKVATDVCTIAASYTTNTAINSGLSPFKKEFIADAKKVLFDLKYPQPWDLFISSTDMQALLSDPTLPEAVKQGAANTGTIPNLYGFQITETPYIYSATVGTTASVRHNFACHAPDITLATVTPKAVQGATTLNITDPESGITIQYFEFGNGNKGSNSAVLRMLYDVDVKRAASGVIIYGA